MKKEKLCRYLKMEEVADMGFYVVGGNIYVQRCGARSNGTPEQLHSIYVIQKGAIRKTQRRFCMLDCLVSRRC